MKNKLPLILLVSGLAGCQQKSEVDKCVEAIVKASTDSKTTAQDIAVIPSMIMLRRMLLLAWVGTHQSSPFAKEVALTFSKDTLDLGARYLGGSLF
jgi:hypothetical protein